MEAQLWTINGLAAQLDIDRRTLTKRLRGLRPAATEKRNDGSVVRRYRLNDVLAHLNRVPGTPRDPTPLELDETWEMLSRLIWRPALPGHA